MEIEKYNFKHVNLVRDGIALHLTLDSLPNRNAMSSKMVEELMSIFEQLEYDSARCLVLRGTGRIFCSGGDIKQFAKDTRSTPPTEGPDPIKIGNRGFGRLLQYLDAAPQVVVAIVEGPAFGGGCGLACASDIVIVHAEAKFALSETSVGVIPAQIAPFVVRRLGVVTARRLALTATRLNGREATTLGLADILCDTDSAIEEALKKVLRGVLRCAPRANASTKSLFAECALKPIATALDDAAEVFARTLRSEGKEGAAAFIEKRHPSWYT